MRLFVGLPFSHQARRDFLQVRKRLERNAVKGNFTAAENFHLTLAFLGEAEPERLPQIFSALEEVKIPPLELILTVWAPLRAGSGISPPSPVLP